MRLLASLAERFGHSRVSRTDASLLLHLGSPLRASHALAFASASARPSGNSTPPLRSARSDAPHPDLSDSELRDVPHVPRTVVDASITTIHPQLRDLIVCPQVAGRVYHVKARGVVEVVLDGLGGAGEVGQARSGEERSKVRPVGRQCGATGCK